MIDWNKIIESHVIKTFRNICYKWWGIDIQFFDEYGNSKSKNGSFQNNLCLLLRTTEKGAKFCLRDCKKNLAGLRKFFRRRFIARSTNALSGKEAVFKIYNEPVPDKAVSMFEREIVEEKAITDEVKKRRHLRIDTFFKVDFKYHPCHNGVISGKATILDLSEAGMFADQVLAIDAKTGDSCPARYRRT